MITNFDLTECDPVHVVCEYLSENVGHSNGGRYALE